MDSRERERPSQRAAINIQEGANKEHQTLEKACDPAVRGIVEIWFVLRESLIADGISRGRERGASF